MPNTDATGGTTATGRRLCVLMPLPLAGAYDYLAPEEEAEEIGLGSFVQVPLGPREVIGVVWGEGVGDVDPAKLKPVGARLNAPGLPDNLRAFVDWVAAYTLAPPGAVLRMVMRVPAALQPPTPRFGYRRAGAPLDGDVVAAARIPHIRVTEARRRVLNALEGGLAMAGPDLAREAGVGGGVIKGLAQAGMLEQVQLPEAARFAVPDARAEGVRLTDDQAVAAAALCDGVAAGRFSVTVLDGVTGSGKTDVYLEAVAQAVAAGRQVLVLLPEIALTPQWFGRFAGRFGVQPAVWHSDLKQTVRRDTWRAVANGEARVVVGARSALFLPFRDLGLIVVDEEHEAAFKQEEGVAYHGRNMAVVRGQTSDCAVVLASATPSLETVVNVDRGRYHAAHLTARFGGATQPQVSAIDMRADPPARGQFLAPRLRQAVLETLAAGEQVMLFLNRRGYAPLTLCRKCGHRIECPHCMAWLVEHRFARSLHCHHCGFRRPVPEACPACEAEASLVACGPGVERIADEVAALAPDAAVEIMTSDTVRGPSAAAELVRAVTEREIDVLIGTQMLAKGHHFPGLTLVGIVDADLGLAGGDLRAGERTFQVLHQVAGRAGRAEKPGRVLLQTHTPEHPVMTALVAGDREGFMALEAASREAAGWPPFGRLAALVISGKDEIAVDDVCAALARRAPRQDGVRVLGPAPAPLALLRGRHRRRMLLKTAADIPVQPLLRAWLEQIAPPARVRIQVDVDPYSFM